MNRNYFEMVFLIDPDLKGFIVIMENASTRWPVSVDSCCFCILIPRPKYASFVGELLLLCTAHSLEGNEDAAEIILQGLAGINNFVHERKSFFFFDSEQIRVAFEISGDVNSGA